MILPVNDALQIVQSGRSVEVQVLRDGRPWLSAPLFSTFYGQLVDCPVEISTVMEAEWIACDAARAIRELSETCATTGVSSGWPAV